MAGQAPPKSRWYRSFYWRIGASFLVLVVAVLAAQSAIFSFIISRSTTRLPGRSPNSLAVIVAADLSAALAEDGGLDVSDYLRQEYGGIGVAIYAVMKDGTVAAVGDLPLNDAAKRTADVMLEGRNFKRTGEEPPGPPLMVTAPIQVDGELRGLVVLPPMFQQRFGTGGLVRALFAPGTALLILAAAIAAAFIFLPARRRLRALESASQRLGAGDLSARAPEQGGDEIARVAAAFNRMAQELAARAEALQASDRQRRQMLADVSHELKTPLTAMRGYIETLHMAHGAHGAHAGPIALDEATRERYFDTIERETLRLDRIVKDLLDLAALENGVRAFDERYFAIARVFDHVSQRHEHEATARRISFEREVADDADQLLADPDRIEQVVENLVANAMSHTPDGGTIRLTATAGARGAIVLTVSDTGVGIPAEHLPHIFDRFYKVDAARVRGSGSGLGLSIAKAIVERHGGTITVKSRPGRTEFMTTLPQP